MRTRLSRREVIRASAAVAAGGVVAPGQTSAPAGEAPEPLPMNPLGKTGVKVTRLGFGASISSYGSRILEYVYRSGIRYFDNADGYIGGQSEGLLGDWINRTGRRDDVFIVTKSHAYEPELLYRAVHRSLEKMKVDTIDLYFVHGIRLPEIPLDPDGEWRKVKERLQREKKIRSMGFSTHADMPVRTACLLNAVKGGWVDALMVACDPGLIKANPDFDRAVDACAKAGVGLACMKTTRGLGRAARQPQNAQDAFKDLGLSPHHAMQSGMFSDGRFAVVVSEMSNFRQIEENTANARAFRKPFDPDQKKLLHEAIDQLSRATCPGCDGQCRHAAGTDTDFSAIARYLCYYEHDGERDKARELFRQLDPAARNWEGADLVAASRACSAHLDFVTLMHRVQRFLA